MAEATGGVFCVPSMPAFVAFFLITLPWLNPFSPGPTSAVGPLLFAWLCTAGVLLAFAFDRQQGQSERMVRAIALAWLCAASLSALIGLLQYFGATAAFGVWMNHTDVGEAFGHLRQRNQFATLINLGLLALVWWHLQSRPTAIAFGLHASLAVLLGVANAASSSRTGLIQLVLVILLMLWWRPGRVDGGQATGKAHNSGWLLIPALSVLAYVAATLALPLLAGLDPLNSGAWARLRAGDAACFSRLTLWRNVLHLIAQKPWLGWGWGELDYAHFITLYPGQRFCDILDNAHNLPLHLAVELGVPVALLVCGVVLGLVWRGRPWRESDPSRQLAWAVLAIVGLHSLLEYPLWYGPFQMAVGLSLWLLWWHPGQLGAIRDFRRFGLLAQYSKLIAATFLIVICGVSGWNYHLASQIYHNPEDRMAAYRVDTVNKTRHLWLFGDQVRFADLTLTEVSAGNAESLHALALDMLHFSPEARVVEKLLDTAVVRQRFDEVAFFAARMKIAFPSDYAAWLSRNTDLPGPH
jgi:O-antigen ligase